ncbi:hypothetical protein CRYUN_Cryun20dG0056200 [Craigia yunnanensis]
MLESDTPTKTFLGVRFCLYGFDPVNEHKDDPVCVAARNDGKTVVTGLWVDHSFVLECLLMLLRPLRDLNGIPGAKREKYELAKKIKKIKLINHRWLEDCGYELEVMEAEAKDSEEVTEETISKQSGLKSLNRNPHNLKSGMLSSSELPNSVVEVSTSTMPRHSPNIEEESGRRNASSIKLAEPHNRSPNCTKVDNSLASSSKIPSLSNEKFTAISYSGKTPRKSPGKSTPPNLSGGISGNISGSPQAMRMKDASDISSSKMQQPEERISSCFVKSPWKGSDLYHGVDSTGILPQKRALELSASSCKSQKMSHNSKAAMKRIALDTERLEPTSLVGDQLQINDCLVDGTGYQSVVHNSCASNATTKSSSNELSSFKIVTAEDRQNNINVKSPKMSFRGYRESTLAIRPDMQNENAYEKSPQMSFKGLRVSTSASRPNIEDCCLEKCVQVVGEPGELQNNRQDVEVPSLDDRKLVTEDSHSPATLDFLKEEVISW